MRKFISAAILIAATGIAAAPAAAVVTYDAFASFTGTNTGGAFTYGVLDDTLAAPTFTAYNDAPGCAALISNVTCTSNGAVPAAFKTTAGAHQSGTVIVPANALILHPGPDAGESSAILFTAPISSIYKLNLSAFVADNNPTGVVLEVFAPGVVALPFASLSAASPSFSTAGLVGFVPAGTQFGIAVNYGGFYNNDSTGINFTLTAVPEPASWALMIAGFGLVGTAARRRRTAVAA